MTTTATEHLTTVITHWTDLTTALDPTGHAPWPPPGRLTDYLTALDQLDADEVAELREARAWQRAGTLPLGRRPVLVRLRVHDTMRAVEAGLLRCTDQVASAIQRPAMSPAPLDWPAADRARRDALAREDAADRRRWSYTNPSSRTAPLAAVWLQHRLESTDGPFRPLTGVHRDRIAAVARGAAERVLAALDMTRRTRAIDQPCPHCRGGLQVEGGDGRPPAVRCTEPACGWARTAETVA